MRRVVAATAIALAVVAAYVWLLYAFFAHLWPLLPLWANVLIVIALAVSFILSPLLLLLRLQ